MRTGFVVVAVLGLTCSPHLLAQSPNSNQASVDYIHSLGAKDGGYYPSAPKAGETPRASLGATNAALRTLKYFGGTPRNPEATARFIASCHQPASGGFGDAPGVTPTVSTTAVGVMALIELNLPTDRYRDGVVKFVSENAKNLEDIRLAAATFESLKMKAPRADEWLALIAKSRNPDGTYGTGTGVARVTGGTAAMILRLGATLENREAVLRAMRSGQRADGGFGTAEQPGSDLASSYRIIRAFYMLKERPADPEKLRAFILKCRNADGGYGVAPGQPSSASGTYYAAIIQHWLNLLK